MIMATNPQNFNIQILGKFWKPQIHKGFPSNVMEIINFYRLQGNPRNILDGAIPGEIKAVFDRKYGSRHLKLAGFKNVEKLKKVFLE